MLEQKAGEIMTECFQKLRRAFLEEFQSEFFGRLQRKPNWSVEELRQEFEATKDRI